MRSILEAARPLAEGSEPPHSKTLARIATRLPRKASWSAVGPFDTAPVLS